MNSANLNTDNNLIRVKSSQLYNCKWICSTYLNSQICNQTANFKGIIGDVIVKNIYRFCKTKREADVKLNNPELTRSISMHFLSASPNFPILWNAFAHSVWNHMHCISFRFSMAVTPSRVNFWHISSASDTRLARSMYFAHLEKLWDV